MVALPFSFAILHYKLKNETGIKVSISATLTVFGTQEKLLWQAMKAVNYESRSQKWRWESGAHDKEDLSSSDEEDDNDDDDELEGAFAKIKPLRQNKQKNWDHWKSETVTPKSPHHYSFSSSPFTPTSSLKVHIIFQIIPS